VLTCYLDCNICKMRLKTGLRRLLLMLTEGKRSGTPD